MKKHEPVNSISLVDLIVAEKTSRPVHSSVRRSEFERERVEASKSTGLSSD